MEIQIIVNGQAQSVGQGRTVLELLRQLDLDPARVAVELNRRIVKQSLWGETVVGEGAQVEIVQFVGGG
jgi:sulfur carrier protein